MKEETNGIGYNNVETAEFFNSFQDCLLAVFFNAGVLFWLNQIV